MSSRNAQRHGVLSQRVTTEMEGAELYEQMLSHLIEEYAPRTETEGLLVQRLANLFWRERRLMQSEQSQLNSQQADPFAIHEGVGHSLSLTTQLQIGRYQTMLTNQIMMTIAQLERLMQREPSD